MKSSSSSRDVKNEDIFPREHIAILVEGEMEPEAPERGAGPEGHLRGVGRGADASPPSIWTVSHLWE